MSLEKYSTNVFLSITNESYYKNLESFYLSFIRILLKREKVTCFIDNNEQFSGLDIEKVIISGLDIWIRDFAPVSINNKFFQFIYSPDYIEEKESEGIRNAFAQIIKNWNIERINLVADGGNLIYNSDNRTLVMTEKIYFLNQQKTRKEIDAIFYDLGVSNIVILPVEPGDIIAHADGMVRWADQDRLFVNCYKEKIFRGKILKILSKKLPNIEIIELPYVINSSIYENINSASGCYINFFETKNAVYVPVFSIPEDEEAAYIMKETYINKPIEFVNSEDIAFYGGVLNCITWGGVV